MSKRKKRETEESRLSAYRITDEESHRSVVVVEARDETEALARGFRACTLMNTGRKIAEGAWLRAEVHEHTEMLVLPYFSDGFFTMQDALTSTKH